MRTETAFVLTAVVLGYAVVSGLVKRWYVAPALIFVAIGMAVGPSGWNVIDAGSRTGVFTVLAQLALTVILFTQASRLDLSTILHGGRITLRLFVVGIPLSILLGAVIATLLLPGLPWLESVCVAAVVAPTEVALIDALLDDVRIPAQVRNTLSVESGFYDGFALAALLAAVAVASARNDPHRGNWALIIVHAEGGALAVGAVIGAIGGFAISRSLQRGWMSDTWAQLATLAVALICFYSGEQLGSSGFVAAFAGGLMFALVVRRRDVVLPTQVSDAAGQLLELLVFALFGAFTVIDGWRHASWRVLVFAVVAVFAVRVVSVMVALLRSRLPVFSRLFIGWFGPRGIGTVVLGLVVIDKGHVQQSGLITQIVVVAVTISLVVHSLSTPLGIRAYERRDQAGIAEHA